MKPARHCYAAGVVRRVRAKKIITESPNKMELDYKALFKDLREADVNYLVVGGLAVNLHGVPRMTYDIDLMVLPEPGNILKVVRRLAEWGYKTKVPVDPEGLADEGKRTQWIREKGMKAMSFYSDTAPLAEIDLLFDVPFSYLELKQRAVKFDLEGEEIPTIDIHDLIELKRHAGRKQDFSDIEHLKLILEDAK